MLFMIAGPISPLLWLVTCIILFLVIEKWLINCFESEFTHFNYWNLFILTWCIRNRRYIAEDIRETMVPLQCAQPQTHTLTSFRSGSMISLSLSLSPGYGILFFISMTPGHGYKKWFPLFCNVDLTITNNKSLLILPSLRVTCFCHMVADWCLTTPSQ